MTREEIHKMRMGVQLGFELLVAEHVEGWRWFTCRERNPQGNKNFALYAPGDPPPEHWVQTPQKRPEFLASHHISASPPNYCESPDADYAVLTLVREKWTDPHKGRFAITLQQMWSVAHECPELLYKPGDYAEAALAVVLADAKEEVR